MASVYKKGPTWYLSFKNHLGKRSPVASKARTKAEAMRLATELEQQAERQGLGLEVRRSTMTFGELADLWLGSHAKGLRSCADETARLRDHLRPTLGSLPLQHVTTLELDKLWTVKGETLEPQTVKHLRGLVQRVFNKAKVWKLWSGENPATLSAMPRVVKQPPNYAQVAEIEAILKAAVGEFRVLAAMAIYTGIREGELLALVRQRVDLERGTIMVIKTQGSDTTKGGKWRPVPLPASLKVILAEHLRTLVGDKVFPKFSSYTGGGARTMISRSLDDTLIAAGLIVRWDHVCRRKGCRKVEVHPDGEAGRKCQACGYTLWPRPIPNPLTFHGLRHSYISHMLMAGADAFAVQRIAGHASIATTLGTYAHATSGYLGEQVKRLPDFGGVLPGVYSEEPGPFEVAQDASASSEDSSGSAGCPWRDSNPRYRLESPGTGVAPADTAGHQRANPGTSAALRLVAGTPPGTPAHRAFYPASTRDRGSALTVAEVAVRLAVSTATVYAMVKAGTIPHRRLPRGGIRFDELQLEAWVLAQESGG
jgi:integrase